MNEDKYFFEKLHLSQLIFSKNTMIYTYLRVSTEHQVLDNQRNEIEKYALKNGFEVDVWITEVASGKTKGKDRKLGNLLKKLKSGDVLIVTEISRLSRTLMDIMSIVGMLLKKGVKLYSIKDNLAFDDSINSKVLLFAFGLVAEIERNLISMRTREALELKRQLGVQLGRKTGSYKKTNILIDNSDRIRKQLDKGCSVAKLCRQYKVSYSTFMRFRKEFM